MRICRARRERAQGVVAESHKRTMIDVGWMKEVGGVAATSLGSEMRLDRHYHLGKETASAVEVVVELVAAAAATVVVVAEVEESTTMITGRAWTGPSAMEIHLRQQEEEEEEAGSNTFRPRLRVGHGCPYPLRRRHRRRLRATGSHALAADLHRLPTSRSTTTTMLVLYMSRWRRRKPAATPSSEQSRLSRSARRTCRKCSKAWSQPRRKIVDVGRRPLHSTRKQRQWRTRLKRGSSAS